jgi:DNA repair protein RadC
MLEGHEREVASMIRSARKLVEAALRESIGASPVDPDDPAIGNYVALLLRNRPLEELHAVFADDAGLYLTDERVATGSANALQLRFSTFIRRAFELGAKRIILAHNHPSNNPEPSQADIEATRHVQSLASTLEITLLDHLIVAGDRVFSMRKAGLI